jgi:hypothetical protein
VGRSEKTASRPRTPSTKKRPGGNAGPFFVGCGCALRREGKESAPLLTKLVSRYAATGFIIFSTVVFMRACRGS